MKIHYCKFDSIVFEQKLYPTPCGRKLPRNRVSDDPDVVDCLQCLSRTDLAHSIWGAKYVLMDRID